MINEGLKSEKNKILRYRCSDLVVANSYEIGLVNRFLDKNRFMS